MSSDHKTHLPEPDAMTIDPANLGSVDPLSVEGIFLVALGKSGKERTTFLAQKCQDESQRQRVEALLAAYEKAGDFLQKPAVTSEPTPIGQYLSPSEVPGTIGRLGTYDIIEEIGRGGMGVVFRAYDPKLQRIVAIKALAPELARLPSARQRFLREARAAAAISHPHVVTIFAVEGTEEASLGTERTTLPFLVMECIVGQTLHDKIKRVGALKVEETIRIARQMAEGLAAAHKRGLIHRDIKPANILLENGVERVKITDFGLARTTSDGGITHTGEILGTPQCMSPEQARGEVVDQRSDLFSLGCVLYTMCTGISPFRSDNILSVMKKVCEETPKPIQQLNSEIPEWLSQLAHQLLHKQPDHRLQSAAEIVQALEARAVISGLSVDTHDQTGQASDRSVVEVGPYNNSAAPITPSPRVSLSASPSGTSISRAPRSPWSILGWMLVGLISVGVLGVLLLAIGIIVPFIMARQSAPLEMSKVVLETHGNKISHITIDGQEVHLQNWEVDDSGRQTFMGYTGPRTLEIQYESDNPQERKLYKSTVNLSGSTTIVDAAPTIRPLASPDAEKSGLNQQPASSSFLANMRAAGAANSPSIALADSVEVLTDPTTMPRYPYIDNRYQTILTHAWVDQPGLVIRLKPLTFEGQENSDVEYIANCAWGVGYFQHTGDGMQQPVELQAGRYRVLVQDLDYGWELDRRGTITLGRGQQTIQVKRSFAGQQMTPTPEGANFRWAGKTYRLKNASEMNAVNEILAAMSSEQTEASRYGVVYGRVDWSVHALKEQFVSTESDSSSKTQLCYQPPMMKLDIPTGLNIKHIDIVAEQGAMYWNRSVPEGFHVPGGQLHYEVIYQDGFSWTGDTRKVLDLQSLSNQTLIVGPLTRTRMRDFVLSGQRTAGDNGMGFYWFDKDAIYLDKHAVKAAERLILAWLDGEPDVSEAELLRLGKVDSWEKLWSNGQSSLPRSNMTFALIPGKEPGTWRMKEPPAGAVQP
ncbi:MAG: protein kinase [Pirellulales bacterium]